MKRPDIGSLVLLAVAVGFSILCLAQAITWPW